METRKVIDLIESREIEVITEWLKNLGILNFLSQTYAKAISQGTLVLFK